MIPINHFLLNNIISTRRVRDCNAVWYALIASVVLTLILNVIITTLNLGAFVIEYFFLISVVFVRNTAIGTITWEILLS